MNQTKETIEGLERLLKSKEIIVERLKKLAPVTMEGVEQDIQFISHAIQILQAHKQAEGELPELKEQHKEDYPEEKDYYKAGQNTGFNQAIDIARPILAKAKLEIKYFEEECECSYRETKKWRVDAQQMYKELQSAKKKIAELQEENKSEDG